MIISDSPYKLTPVYNPSVFTVFSTNVNEDNFKYIMEVFNNKTGERIFKKPLPAMDFGYGVFDVSRLLQTKTSADIFPLTIGIREAVNSFYRYNISFGEQYIYHFPFNFNFNSGGNVGFSSITSVHYFNTGDTVFIQQGSSGATDSDYDGVHTITSVPNNHSFVIDEAFGTGSTAVTGITTINSNRVTQFTGLTSSTLNYAANSAIPYVDYISYNGASYQLKSGSTGAFLTNVPDRYLMALENEAYVLGYATALTEVQYIRYDLSNGQTYRRLNTSPSSATTFAIAVGARNINNTPGMVGVINLTIDSYSAYTENVMSARTSEVLTFEVDKNCTMFKNYHLIFMDRKGSMMGFNFDLISEVDTKIERTEYKKLVGGVNSAGQWSYQSYNRGRTVSNVDITKTFIVRSNWVNENVGLYLGELASTSEAYHIDDNGNWLPIIITNSSFKDKYQVVDKLINVEINFEYAFRDAVQS